MPVGPYQFVDDFTGNPKLPSADLWNFGVAHAVPLPSHFAWLDAVVEVIEDAGDPVRIWIDGQASHTGDRVFNQHLSEKREIAIEGYLRRVCTKIPVFISRQWEGFAVAAFRGHALGVENARDRCVRVVVWPAASPPPPPPRVDPLPVMVDTLTEEVYMRYQTGATGDMYDPADWGPWWPWTRVFQTFGKTQAGVKKSSITHELRGENLLWRLVLRNGLEMFRSEMLTVHYSYDPPATSPFTYDGSWLQAATRYPDFAEDFQDKWSSGVRTDPPESAQP